MRPSVRSERTPNWFCNFILTPPSPLPPSSGTLINFIATERGLEDQLLAKVVGKERPDLEAKSQELSAASVQYKIQLVQLEDDLLERLANAPEDILSDVPLIEGLEATKQTSTEINIAVEIGKKTQAEIGVAREAYRPQASEGAMLYFLLTKLCAINHMYQYERRERSERKRGARLRRKPFRAPLTLLLPLAGTRWTPTFSSSSSLSTRRRRPTASRTGS